jgi:hypothetical protein
LRWREKGGEVIAGTVSCEVIIGILVFGEPMNAGLKRDTAVWSTNCLGQSRDRLVIDRNFDRAIKPPAALNL